MNDKRHQLTNLKRPLAVLDSEWTSGSPAKARIISLAIAVLRPDGSIDSNSWLVDPGTPIEARTTAVHGITDEHVAGKPAFRDIAGEVDAVLHGCDLCGYAINGDLQLLERELAESGMAFNIDDRKVVDPLRLWQRREPRKLTDAYRKFVGGEPDDFNAHDAGDDVRMTVRILERMADGADAETLHAEGNPQMVDPAGKFTRDDNGEILFAFGKYHGTPIAEHADYLEWMRHRDFAPSTLKVVEATLDHIYGHTDDDQPDKGDEDEED